MKRTTVRLVYGLVLLTVLAVTTVSLAVINVFISGIPEGACHETPDGGDGCPEVPMPHPTLDVIETGFVYATVIVAVLLVAIVVARVARRGVRFNL